MEASGEIRLLPMTMRRMPVLAQSGCYSLCMFSTPGISAAGLAFSVTGMDSTNPSSFSIIGSQNNGTSTYFSYQLNDANGNALTGPGYSVEEDIEPPIGQTSNHQYVPIDNGVAIDNVGYNAPQTGNTYTVTTQTFSVSYQGYFYELSSIFLHLNSFYQGVYNNSVTVIQP